MSFCPNHYQGCKNSCGGLVFRRAQGSQLYEIYNFRDLGRKTFFLFGLSE